MPASPGREAEPSRPGEDHRPEAPGDAPCGLDDGVEPFEEGVGRPLPHQPVEHPLPPLPGVHATALISATFECTVHGRGTVLGDDEMAAALADGLVCYGRMVGLVGAGHRVGDAPMLGKRSEGDAG